MHNESFIKRKLMKESVISQPSRPRRAVPGAIAAGAFDLSVHFEGLANPTRLAVVTWLAAEPEMTVSDLAERCRVSQPRMSWHLRILRRARVVATRRDGREVLCRLDRDSIRQNFEEFMRLVSVDRPNAATPVKPVSEGTL
jgi:DNA-binding transcriptional ArsR family regulator